jgi:uncharacterized protein
VIIEQAWLDEVKQILQWLVPDREVRAVGSRVRGNCLEFSDLDLVIMGDEPLGMKRRQKLLRFFDASDIPIRIDVIDWAATDPGFRPYLMDTWEVVQWPLIGADELEPPQAANA